MKPPQILTGQQAIDQFGLNALIECRVAITTELNGLGHSVMQIGVIADPDNCFIDLSDEPAVLYVEIEQDDDWILHPIMADEQFVLLDDKNQQAKTYGAKTPEQIYLIPDAEHGQVWCDTPAPGEGMREEDATRYVREDIYLALQAQVNAMRYELSACQSVLFQLARAGEVTPAYADDAKKVLNSTPEQCLAAHDAKAYKEGGSAQKAFWDGFERGAINGAANIRQHWNEYKQLRQQAKAGSA